MARRSRRKVARHPQTFLPTVYHTGIVPVEPYPASYGDPLADLAFEGAKNRFFKFVSDWWMVGLIGVGAAAWYMGSKGEK